jgi:hypothetical protein
VSDGRAIYPIPADNDSVDGILCITAYVPNSTDWIQTFYRVLRTMAQGRYWDGDTGIVVEAQEIGLAIWETAQMHECEGGCDCQGELEIIQQQIIQLQEIVNEMSTTITIHNNVGCCGGENSTTTTTTGGNGGTGATGLPTGWGDIDWDGDYPMSTQPPPTDNDFDEWKCNVAKNMLAGLRTVLVNVAGLVGTAEENTEQVQGYLIATLSWLDGDSEYLTTLWATYYLMATYVIEVFTAGMSIATVNWLDDHNEELRNALYCGENLNESTANFNELVNQSGLGLIANQFVKLAFKMTKPQALYYDVSERTEVTEYAGECNCEPEPFTCESLNLPSGWTCLQAQLSMRNASGGGLSTLVDNGDGTYTANIIADQYESYMTLDRDNLPDHTAIGYILTMHSSSKPIWGVMRGQESTFYSEDLLDKSAPWDMVAHDGTDTAMNDWVSNTADSVLPNELVVKPWRSANAGRIHLRSNQNGDRVEVVSMLIVYKPA